MAKLVEELDRAEVVDLLRLMMLIRRFEERAAEAYARRQIGGFLHLSIGQEAVAVGAVPLLRPTDYVISHYREHGHALARGLDPKAVMAELYGKATGVCRGRGGSMHLIDVSRNFMGGYAIVGGHLPLAVGLALACKMQGRDDIVLCILGEGAVNEGEFHESLNLASVWRLPVFFLCENNLYAMGTAHDRTAAVTEIYRRAEAYSMAAARVDGNDLFAVREACQRAIARVRAGEGPFFLEALTYRWRGHSMADAELYRSKQEVEEWRRRDPIRAFREQTAARSLLPEGAYEELEEEVEQVVQEAARFAEESPDPELEDLYRSVYSDRQCGPRGEP